MFGESVRVPCVHDYDKECRVLTARRPDKDQLEAWKWGVVLVESLGSGALNEHQRATVQVLWEMFPPLE